jgi:probable HAF family extracellular repeat protein
MTDLGVPPGEFGDLSSVNVFGQVVATFCPIPCNGTQHAFLWTKRTGWFDLNDLIPSNSGWELEVAYDVNDWGQITGYGLINGKTHAFLLTPNLTAH